MMLNSYEAQRETIQGQVDHFFRKKINITPRAFAALQGTYRADWTELGENYVIEAESVFHALLTVCPASQLALSDAGVALERLSILGSDCGPAPLASSTLDHIFRKMRAIFPLKKEPWCKAASAISEKKTLTETDLLRAFVQTAYNGPKHFNQAVSKVDFVTAMSSVGSLLEDAGFIDIDAVEETWDGNPGTYRAKSLAAQKLSDLVKRFDTIDVADPSHNLFQFAIWQDSKGMLRVRPFGVGSLGISGPDTSSGHAAQILREGVLQPASAVSDTLGDDSLRQFEEMINTQSCSETEFQRFFSAHPQFLVGLDYGQIHSQLALFSEEGKELVPDFFLEPLGSQFCDILELKLPYETLVSRLRNGNRARFRSIVSEAVAQLTEYRRYFESSSNRDFFHEQHKLQAYYPNMILVIGRRHHFKSDVERQELKAMLPKDLALWTYDDLLARAHRYQKWIKASTPLPRPFAGFG